MLPDVARFTERMAEGPLEVNGPGRLHLFGVFAYDRDPDSRDAGFFDLSLDQSHGLVADASRRGQQDCINGVLAEFLDKLPG